MAGIADLTMANTSNERLEKDLNDGSATGTRLDSHEPEQSRSPHQTSSPTPVLKDSDGDDIMSPPPDEAEYPNPLGDAFIETTAEEDAVIASLSSAFEPPVMEETSMNITDDEPTGTDVVESTLTFIDDEKFLQEVSRRKSTYRMQ